MGQSAEKGRLTMVLHLMVVGDNREGCLDVERILLNPLAEDSDRIDRFVTYGPADTYHIREKIIDF